MPVITLTGDNQHQVRAELKKVIAAFVKQHGELAVERFDGEEADIEQILSAISATSLFNPEKLVVIQSFEASKALTEQTETILEQTPEETTVVIVINKLDKRVAYGKQLKQSSDWREFNNLAPNEIVTWVQQVAKDKGGTIDRGSAQYLVDFAGANQSRLSNELDKLILFDPTITRETINQLVEREPSSTVFELLDAGFNGHEKRALDLYEEQRRLQMEPIALMGMIGWQLHILAVVKTAKGKPAAAVAKDAGVHPFVVQKSQKLASNMSLAKLRQLVHQAVNLEVDLKNRRLAADDAVKHFLLSL